MKNHTKFDPSELQTFSPFQLTEKGKNFIKEIGFDNVFEKNKEVFFRFIDNENPKLKFDVVLDVLTTKVEEMQAATEAQEIKEHNKKIITLISEKQDESLKGKSIRQLEAMLK